MDSLIDYNHIKIIHITAVIIWIGVMICTPAMILVAGKLSGGARFAAAAGIRSWYLKTASAAMIVAWIFGISLMSIGNWFNSGWMMAKLGLVIGLSAVHGILSGRLRRLASDISFQPSKHFTTLIWLQIAAVFVIATLVVLKPF